MSTQTTNLLTCDLLLAQLQTEGVKVFFQAPASGNSLISNRLKSQANKTSGLLLIDALTEQQAAFEAIGYAQASSRPTVLLLSTACGLSNCMSAVYTALHMCVPLLIILEEPHSELLNEPSPLTMNISQLAGSVTKFACQARSSGEISRLVRRAFTEANSPARGPVLLSVPADILAQQAQTTTIAPPHSSPLGPADHNFIIKTARSLVAARNPCIIAGNEVSQYRARKELATLAEVLGAPVFIEPLPTGANFANRHPQFACVLPFQVEKARELLQSHDLILALGMQTRLPSHSSQAPVVSHKTAVIQINVDPLLAGRSMPSIAAANADLAESLSRVRSEIQMVADAKWLNMAKARAQETLENIQRERQLCEENLEYPEDNAAITAFWLLRSLDGMRPNQSIITSDLSSWADNPITVMSLEGSSAYFASNAGLEGYAIGCAIGTQLASPDSLPIAITSEIGMINSFQALWTAVNLKMHIKTVVINSMGKSSNLIKNTLLNSQSNANSFTQTGNLSVPEMARSMKIESQSVSTMGELNRALAKMFETPASFLLDVQVTTP
jgi:benzoylformate decarboxylase